MQEDIERRSVAVTVQATKLTARALAKAIAAALRGLRKKTGQPTHGRQTTKQLMKQGAATNTIPLDGNTRQWDRVARKYKVDYAFYKTGPKKYLLLFKAGQSDAITAAFSEYTKRVLSRSAVKRPSILEQLRKSMERVRERPRQKERKREAEHGDR